jgi:tripartite-type tricarboxylate transporter receptor subunit TctC
VRNSFAVPWQNRHVSGMLVAIRVKRAHRGPMDSASQMSDESGETTTMKRNRNCWTALLVMATLAALHGAAFAQSFPSKPVRIVVPYPGGGGVDVLARVIAERLSQQWGQPVLTDTRPGANTIIGTEIVAKAAPDGHTLLLTTDATFTINPHLYAKLPYDPFKDFQPVTLLVFFGQMMVANPSLPANSIAELVALAKARPGTISYASYGSGSQAHLATEMLKSKAAIDLLHVPYKGLQPAVTATIAGEVPLTFVGVASGLPQIRAGKLKPLAISGPNRSSLIPNMPTFAETGFPDVDANVWFGLLAPAGTPREIVERIHRDVVKAMGDSQFRDTQVASKGYDYAGLGPDEFAAHIRKEFASRREVVKISGAKAE